MSVDFRKLVKAGVHFGHQTSRWSPKMAPFIWGHKNKIHLIDVSKTAHQLDKAVEFLKSVAAEGKQILWVGTKKPAQKIIEAVSTELSMPFVIHRWLGGTLSNNAQIKKAVTKYLHIKDVIDRADKFPHYTKKEINNFQKMAERLEKSIGGIVNLKWPIGALVIVDASKEKSAIQEAAVMGIPVVGIVDTNSDPSGIDYIIPGNDDAPSSINALIEPLKEAIIAGVKDAQTKTKDKKIQDELAAKADKENKELEKKAVIKSAQKRIEVQPKEDTKEVVTSAQSVEKSEASKKKTESKFTDKTATTKKTAKKDNA